MMINDYDYVDQQRDYDLFVSNKVQQQATKGLTKKIHGGLTKKQKPVYKQVETNCIFEIEIEDPKDEPHPLDEGGWDPFGL